MSAARPRISMRGAIWARAAGDYSDVLPYFRRIETQ